MTSSNHRDAGRAAEDFDNARKDAKLEGREFPAYGRQEPEDLSPASQAALSGALAQIERAFGKGAIRPATQMEDAA